MYNYICVLIDNMIDYILQIVNTMKVNEKGYFAEIKAIYKRGT